MSRARWVVLVAVIAMAVAIVISMPETTRTLPTPAALGVPVRGAIHIHTRRSDGSGSVDDVAGAAAKAGLKFVIVTDHGDGTREPDAPIYRQGVLCIDALEISTTSGHLVALGLARSPYSLGGETRDVVEDVARMGGMAIAAHPESARAELRWTDWSAPVNGLEWINADSEWRDESVASIFRTLLTYPFRKPETLAALLDRPEQALRRWEESLVKRPVVALAAADAHARIPLTSVGDPYDSRVSLHLPGYEQVFRTFSIGLPDVALSGDPAADAGVVVDAIRRGRVFSSIDAIAGPVAFSFTATSEDDTAVMGQDIVAKGSLTFRVQSNAPAESDITLLRDGHAVRTVTGSQLEYSSADVGVYRVEVHAPRAPGQPPVPWILSNPIYVLARPRAANPVATAAAPAQANARYSDGPATDWHVENSPRSQGALDVVGALRGTQLLMRYALGGSEDEAPFVAFAMNVPEGLAGYNRLMFTAQSSRATRMWIQVRVPGTGQGRSWHRSVYVDDSTRALSVTFDEMRPLEATTTGGPVLADVRDVLFVIDTVNTRPGVNGQLWIDDISLAK